MAKHVAENKLIYFRTVSGIFLTVLLNLTTGCHHYKAATVANKKNDPGLTSKQLANYKKANKYFVVHQGDKMWHLRDARVNQQDSTLQGTFEEVDSVHMHYIVLMQQARRAPFKREDKAAVLSQVHVYVLGDALGQNDSAVIPFSSIQKIDYYYHPKGATVFWTVIPIGLGVTVWVFILYANSFQ